MLKIGGPDSVRSDHYHHGMLHSLFMFSFSVTVHFRKTLSQKKEKTSNKVRVDVQTNADQNWSVQPKLMNNQRKHIHQVRTSVGTR